MSINLPSLLRKRKPAKRTAPLVPRPHTELANLASFPAGPLLLLLDTNVYINRAARRLPHPITEETESLPKAGAPCPICTGPTILRRGPHGHFYGCSKYPHAKGL